jgi:hypothetical protein
VLQEEQQFKKSSFGVRSIYSTYFIAKSSDFLGACKIAGVLTIGGWKKDGV